MDDVLGLGPTCRPYCVLAFRVSGRLPNRRLRWFAWFSLLLIVGGTISQALAPRSVYYLRAIHNPLGVEGLPNYGKLIETVMFTLVFVSAGSLFVRRLRASGVERQQLKWFTYSSTLAISGVILTYTISDTIRHYGWCGSATQF